jgi:glycosyltransferase involved in cell wall biosynthesis
MHRVVTVHDAIFVIHPEFHTKLRVLWFGAWIKLASRCSVNIICVSKSTQNDLIHLWGGSIYNKSIVIPLGVKQQDKNYISTTSNKSKYILFIGTIEPRKNVDILIEAYLGSRVSLKYKLFLVGKFGWKSEKTKALIQSASKQNVVYFDYIEESEKWNLLNGADLLVYPSSYEGFGLPVLEAMSAGCPVLTSYNSSLIEIGGDAVFYSELSVDSISHKIEEIIQNNALKIEYINRGIEQVKKFTWDNTVKKTMAFYSEVLLTGISGNS